MLEPLPKLMSCDSYDTQKVFSLLIFLLLFHYVSPAIGIAVGDFSLSATLDSTCASSCLLFEKYYKIKSLRCTHTCSRWTMVSGMWAMAVLCCVVEGLCLAISSCPMERWQAFCLAVTLTNSLTCDRWFSPKKVPFLNLFPKYTQNINLKSPSRQI